MRIVCPTCSAAYEVPDRMLGTGKKLRCARCAGEWVPAEVPAEAVEAAPVAVVAPVVVAPPPVVVPVAVPVPAAVPPRSEPVLHPPALHADGKPPASADPPLTGRLPVVLALGGSALVLVGLVATALVWRGALMQAWPPSQRLFGMLGLG